VPSVSGSCWGIVQTVIELLAQLDDLLRIFGGLAIAFSVVALGVYVWSREELFVVSVAGEDDVELLAGDDADDDLLDRLQAAIQPGGPSPAATAGGFGDGDEPEGSEPLESKLNFGSGEPTTDQASGDTFDSEPESTPSDDDTAPVDHGDADQSTADDAAVENVLDAMDADDGEAVSDATDDGTLDLTDPSESN